MSAQQELLQAAKPQLGPSFKTLGNKPLPALSPDLRNKIKAKLEWYISISTVTRAKNERGRFCSSSQDKPTGLEGHHFNGLATTFALTLNCQYTAFIKHVNKLILCSIKDRQPNLHLS